MVADHDSAHGQFAAAFAHHLVAGQFEAAHAMLSPKQQRQLSAAMLQEEYSTMVEYGDSAPNSVELISTLQTWPDRKKSDLGWAYVAISGDDFSEAVTVIVAQMQDKTVIRQIEWGRP
jgi:hypothetical protein